MALSMYFSAVHGDILLYYCMNLFPGPFLLTELLLDMLKESAPARIINTTASAQNLGDINFDDVNHENGEYTLGDMYAQSKLAVVLHTFQLAERLKGNLCSCESYLGWLVVLCKLTG